MKQNQMLFEAILSLQNSYRYYSANNRSKLAEVADKAISLALSPKRKKNQFLSTNSFKNAFSSVNKAAKRRRIIVLPALENECTNFSQKEAYQKLSTESPEAAIDKNLLCKRLLCIASAVHRDGAYVFSDMLKETPVAETAAALNCSVRTIESIRSYIRIAIKRHIKRSEVWN